MAADSHKTFCASGRRSGWEEAGESADAVVVGGYDHGRGEVYCRDEE